MQKAWKEWEGAALNSEIRLGQYLGGSERGGVFLTAYGPESRKAVVKLVPVSGNDADIDRELARLRSATALSHPHLVQIFEAGRTSVDEQPTLFVVMEQADEDLSQILPSRPLSAAEVRDMLEPTLQALAYLHGQNLVHGRLKPANVMAIGDQLKLSSDGIAHIAEQNAVTPPGIERHREMSDYDAPELAHGQISPASDVWSLGMLLVAMLTQRLPQGDAGREEIVLPDRVPAPFEEIARRCLRPDPRDRCTLENIAVRAGLLKAVAQVTAKAPATMAAATDSAKPPRAAVEEGSAVAQPESRAAAPESRPPKRVPVPEPAKPAQAAGGAKPRSHGGAYLVAAMVLAVLGVFGIARLFRASSGTQATAGSATAPQQPSATKPKRVRADSAKANSGRRGETSEMHAASASGAPAQPAISPAREMTSRRGMTAGQVAEQILPDVPVSARNTIHGTVRVAVRVSVDASGAVTNAELDSPGPSKYFAQLALDSAQRWRFEPPKMDGRGVLSDWLLRYEFTRQGTKVVPVQADP
jgi:TonB family protein